MSYASRFQIFSYYLLSVLVLTIFTFRSTSTYLGYPKYYIILLIALPYFIAGIARTLLEANMTNFSHNSAVAPRTAPVTVRYELVCAAGGGTAVP